MTVPAARSHGQCTIWYELKLECYFPVNISMEHTAIPHLRA